MPEKYQPVRITPIEDKIYVGENQKKILRVNIDSDEYDICDETSRNMWANKKNGRWGRGLINTKDDPYRVERIGRLGEMAFSKVTGLDIDLDYREYGDKGDFFINDIAIDIKTAGKLYRYKSGLVRAADERGKKLPLNNDIYVFAYLNESIEKKKAQVVLVGWEKKENIEKLPLSPAKLGRHKNYEVSYGDLLELDEFFDSVGINNEKG